MGKIPYPFNVDDPSWCCMCGKTIKHGDICQRCFDKEFYKMYPALKPKPAHSAGPVSRRRKLSGGVIHPTPGPAGAEVRSEARPMRSEEWKNWEVKKNILRKKGEKKDDGSEIDPTPYL